MAELRREGVQISGLVREAIRSMSSGPPPAQATRMILLDTESRADVL